MWIHSEKISDVNNRARICTDLKVKSANPFYIHGVPKKREPPILKKKIEP